jgi:hypothetical protein
MQPISYARHQFPPAVIRQAVWLYLRFTLSYREVEELLAERGLDGASACGCGGRSTMRARAEAAQHWSDGTAAA